MVLSLLLEAHFRQLSFLLKIFMSLLQHSCQDPDQETRQMEEEHIKRDRLTGQCKKVLVTFKLIVKEKYEEKRKMKC